ncbi:MAG TPA: hypothetical protein VD978_29495 [Azospirillum sp.]|nr:hypothetical protein [Azospirillum sp.]
MKNMLLMGASVIVLTIGAAASAAAQSSRIDHVVIGNNNGEMSDTAGRSDNQSTRTNGLNNGSFDGAAGVSHAMQNNGSNNAVSSSDAVVLNARDALGQTGRVNARVGDNSTSDYGRTRANDISGSYRASKGMFSVQQNNGDNNSVAGSNQVQVKTGNEAISSLTDTNQSIDGVNNAYSTGSSRQNTIQNNSFNNAKGILNLQQNNGDNNAMAQTNTVAVGVRTTGLEQRVTSTGRVGAATGIGLGSSAYDQNVTRSNSLNNAFQNATGIVGIQQNNGNNNVMSSTNAIGVTVGGLGMAAQSAALEATVSNAYSVQSIGATPSTLTNNASNIMTGAKGVMTLQQNNGNNNVMQSAVMVSANIPARP